MSVPARPLIRLVDLIEKGQSVSSIPRRTCVVAGSGATIAAVIANYACGHCNSDTDVHHDARGMPHLRIHHDDGCPVLAGALSPVPDTLRAATAN
jgi:N-acetylglucosamine kinase-like BadF-type ATPase